jgi:YVTN family beta-propeller protein
MSPRILLLACAALFAIRASAPATTMSRVRSSSIAVTPDGGLLVVANPDSASVSIVDVASRMVRREIGIGGTPQTLFVDDERAFVARQDGRVSVVELATFAVRSANVGVELFGVVGDGERLFVSDAGASMIRVVDAESLAQIGTIATESEPRGLAMDAAARRLYVTHFSSGRISVIDLEAMHVTQVISTGADSNLSASLVLFGDRAYVPQTRSNANNPALLFDSTLFPIVSAIDLAANANVSRERISLDITDRPINVPFDAAVTSDRILYVANAGSDDVSLINLATRQARNIKVGSHPRGIVLSPDETLAFVNNALSGTVSVIDTSTRAIVDTIEVTTIPLSPRILNGKILFHTSARTSIANDQWISCASCHFDGRADGRTWFFRDGPRNTPPLFGVASTLPMHWSGDLDELHDVENTIRIIQAGTGLAAGDPNCTPACDTAPPNRGRSQDLDDLALYMATLQGPQRTFEITDAARRGAVLFERECASCHPAPLYTDREKHDVGTGNSALERKGSAFDTPSLRGAYDSAPYLHDGSAPTLHDAIVKHTRTALTSAEIDDVAEFVSTIPFPRVRRRASSGWR